MVDTTTALYEVQRFMPEQRKWVRETRFTGVYPSTARDLWRGVANATDDYVRLCIVSGDDWRDSVMCGSASDDPIQSAEDARETERYLNGL